MAVLVVTGLVSAGRERGVMAKAHGFCGLSQETSGRPSYDVALMLIFRGRKQTALMSMKKGPGLIHHLPTRNYSPAKIVPR